MKLNEVTELDVNVDETDLYVELEGKLVTVGNVYSRQERGGTKVVLVPTKPRVRKSRAQVATKSEDQLSDNN